MTTELPQIVKAPWTEEEVQALNAFQSRNDVHPFTCGNCSDQLLFATSEGWRCAECDYTQDWAHPMMLDPDFSPAIPELQHKMALAEDWLATPQSERFKLLKAFLLDLHGMALTPEEEAEQTQLVWALQDIEAMRAALEKIVVVVGLCPTWWDDPVVGIGAIARTGLGLQPQETEAPGLTRPEIEWLSSLARMRIRKMARGLDRFRKRPEQTDEEALEILDHLRQKQVEARATLAKLEDLVGVPRGDLTAIPPRTGIRASSSGLHG